MGGRHIIEPAKDILHPRKMAQPRVNFLFGIKRRKEMQRIAQLLQSLAKLVTFLAFKFLDGAAKLHRLFQPPVERLRGKVTNEKRRIRFYFPASRGEEKAISKQKP